MADKRTLKEIVKLAGKKDSCVSWNPREENVSKRKRLTVLNATERSTKRKKEKGLFCDRH